jgi:hypothetical protein
MERATQLYDARDWPAALQVSALQYFNVSLTVSQALQEVLGHDRQNKDALFRAGNCARNMSRIKVILRSHIG